MLAANGSIFTILAISFERYYAICKPLEAGYKCTRLRATVIICLIWLLASVLTSPILIMAKSTQLVYIDGSLVYNCILVTDTYWPKMYVIVSLFAFFCLPLLVLMLVYWLIGRRLTRETLAMGTTASLAANGSIETSTSCQTTSSKSTSINYKQLKRVFLNNKTSPLKALLSSKQANNYHYFNGHQSNGPSREVAGRDGSSKQAAQELKSLDEVRSGEGKRQRGSLPARRASLHQASSRAELVSGTNQELAGGRMQICKALSLDHQQLTSNLESKRLTSCTGGQQSRTASDATQGAQEVPNSGSVNGAAGKALCNIASGIRQALQFINKMFHSKSSLKSVTKEAQVLMAAPDLGNQRSLLNQADRADDSSNCNGALRSSGVKSTKQTLLLAHTQTDRYGSTNHEVSDKSNQAHDKGQARHNGLHQTGVTIGSRYLWFKSSSVSSSYGSEHFSSTTMQQDSICTPRSCRIKSILSDDNSSQIIRIDRSRLPPIDIAKTKKSTRFDLNPIPDDYPLKPSGSCSSTSDPISTPYSSHSCSPDSMFEYNQQESISLTIPEKNLLSADRSQSKETARSLPHMHRDSVRTASQNEAIRFLPGETNELVRSKDSCDTIISNQSCSFQKKTRSRSISESSDYCTELDQSIPHKTADIGYIKSSPRISEQTDTNRLERSSGRTGSQQDTYIDHVQAKVQLSDFLVVQDVSKKQQMDSRRQVVVMLAFVVACFFLLFFPYRLFTIWLIFSTEDQVQSLGMEAYYNLTYFSRILIYLHSAINPIAYNLISTKFRRAFMSILLCRGSSSRRHFTTEHQLVKPNSRDGGQKKVTH